MFKISTQQRTYSWPIDVRYPMNGGKFGKASFTATFKQLPQSEIDTLLGADRDSSGDADTQLVGGRGKRSR